MDYGIPYLVQRCFAVGCRAPLWCHMAEAGGARRKKQALWRDVTAGLAGQGGRLALAYGTASPAGSRRAAPFPGEASKKWTGKQQIPPPRLGHPHDAPCQSHPQGQGKPTKAQKPPWSCLASSSTPSGQCSIKSTWNAFAPPSPAMLLLWMGYIWGLPLQ